MAKERSTDSVAHHEERHEKMRAEAAELQQAAAKAQAQRESSRVEREQYIREAENQDLTQQVGLVQQGDTREMLLDRIRKQREDKPAEVAEQPVYRSPELQKQFEAEQQAGRAAVAKNEAAEERGREARRKYEEEDRARQGTMETVHHPNPSQDEVYPTSKNK